MSQSVVLHEFQCPENEIVDQYEVDSELQCPGLLLTLLGMPILWEKNDRDKTERDR